MHTVPGGRLHSELLSAPELKEPEASFRLSACLALFTLTGRWVSTWFERWRPTLSLTLSQTWYSEPLELTSVLCCVPRGQRHILVFLA